MKPPRGGGRPAEARPLSSAAADVRPYCSVGSRRREEGGHAAQPSYMFLARTLVLGGVAAGGACGLRVLGGVATGGRGGVPNLANKTSTQKSNPVNTSCLHQRQPTTKVRINTGSKRGHELKAPLSPQSSMILILAAGMSSVGRRSVNACAKFDLCRHNGF
ncbi:hypothetical protein THAOC_13577 [Thalassiosira oceanica]|uniref:Uncharacterized protein n=1 Tax=Thalassiosira oceanica TaxID=159749 RepID=K0T566_THAOC|nr:hypothetical protein THAOC_13577 [Thalassiosira oceanica]|eukprot:EJK65547.1 hypothetical protein THAOC_13577 [Thalassiosira oceanica]